MLSVSKIRNLSLIPPENEHEFENLCLALWKRILRDPNFQFVGRRGQSQGGVDLIGRRDGTLNWIGIQCKVWTGGILAKNDVRKDVKNAKDFNPRLSELVFATTARRDQKLQEFARELTEENVRTGSFSVTIFAWDDIKSELSKETNLDVLRRFYRDTYIDYERLGIAISRIVRLSIGVGHTPDTGYELLIGKTPSLDNPDSYLGLDYWKGNYFIGNWNQKILDTFPLPAFPSDLEHVFPFKRDAYIIAKWLTSIKSIDDLIYGDDEEHVMLISKDEYREYLDLSRG